MTKIVPCSGALWAALVLVPLAFAQSPEGTGWAWVTDTADEFARGNLYQVVVQTSNGGELTLSPSFRRVSVGRLGRLDPDIKARDARGNLYRAWFHGQALLLQKVSTDSTILWGPVHVNEAPVESGGYVIRVAASGQGNLLVMWSATKGGGVRLFYQMVTGYGRLIGGNRAVSDYVWQSTSRPIVFWNQFDNHFWVLAGVWYSGKQQLRVWRITPVGDLDGSFLLPAGIDSRYKLHPAATLTPDSLLVVAWLSGEDVFREWDTRVCVRCYSWSGKPLTGPLVASDPTSKRNYSPAVVSFRDSLLVVAWTDCREVSGRGLDSSRIYGQWFTTRGMRVGPNVCLSDSVTGWQENPRLETKEGDLWVLWASDGSLYFSRWRFDPIMAGRYVSPVFDTGPGGADYLQLSWEDSLPLGASLALRVRSSTTRSSLPGARWFGPAGTDDFYTHADGQIVNPVHDGDRYVQYEASFHSSVPGNSPVLKSVVLSFIPADTVPPPAPETLVARSAHSSVFLSWSRSRAPDVAAYRIYRRTSVFPDYRLLGQVSAVDTSFSDTSAVSGATYYYAVSSVDSSHNEGPLSAEASARPYGVTLYVDAYSKVGDGSRENPFPTIAEGLHAASFGDTVFVFPGQYHENVDMKPGVVLRGAGATETTIQGVNAPNRRYVVKGAGQSVLKGFCIVDPGGHGQNPWAGVRCDADSLVISDNIFISRAPRAWAGSAVLSTGSGLVVKRNVFRGFHHALTGIGCKKVVFRNNLSIDAGIQTIYEAGIRVINNTFVLTGSEYHDVLDLSELGVHVVKNNIAYGPNTSVNAINCHSNGGDVVSFNDFYVGGEVYVDCPNPGPNISVDPGFLDAERGDYRLAASSPCVDAGDPHVQYNDVDGSRNDMGAFGGPDPLSPALALQMFASVFVSDTAGFPGDTVQVAVSVNQAAGLARLSFALEFDPQLLEPLAVWRTALTQRFDLQADLSQPGQVVVDLSSASEIPSGNGALAAIDFLISSAAKGGQASPLDLSGLTLEDGAGSGIRVSQITSGVVAVNRTGLGDRCLYVDAKRAGEEGDGTLRAPFATIGEALNAAHEGDTVFVAGGSYHEILEVDKPICLIGTDPRVLTVAAGDGNKPADYVVRFTGTGPCRIEGFTFRNATPGFVPSVLLVQAPGVQILGNRVVIDEATPGLLIKWDRGAHGVLSGNYLSSGGDILDVRGTDSLLVEANTFVATSVGTFALRCQGSKVIVRSNRFKVAGPATAVQAEAQSRLRMLNNIVESQGEGGSGVVLVGAEAEVLNNTFCTRDVGVDVGDASAVDLQNNIVVGSRVAGVRASSPIHNAYNDVWGNVSNYLGLSPGTGSISRAPMFVDSLNGDFHLLPDSPCRDAGNPEPGFADHDGSRNDMGAFGGPFADTTGFLSRRLQLHFQPVPSVTGDSLELGLFLQDVAGLAEAEIEVQFDPNRWEVLGVDRALLTRQASLAFDRGSSGKLRITAKCPAPFAERKGSLCLVKLRRKGAADSFAVFSASEALFRDRVGNVYHAPPVEQRLRLTNVVERSGRLARKFGLFQNYPNPFNVSTSFRFNLARKAHVNLAVYNLRGQRVRLLLNELQPAGTHRVRWDATDDTGRPLPSGVYLVRLRAGGQVAVRKVVLVR